MPKYTFVQRRRIHAKAKRKAGVKKQGDPQEHADYMRQCISDMLQSGETEDSTEAEIICQMLWEEEQAMDDLYGD